MLTVKEVWVKDPVHFDAVPRSWFSLVLCQAITLDGPFVLLKSTKMTIAVPLSNIAGMKVVVEDAKPEKVEPKVEAGKKVGT